MNKEQIIMAMRRLANKMEESDRFDPIEPFYNELWNIIRKAENRGK